MHVCLLEVNAMCAFFILIFRLEFRLFQFFGILSFSIFGILSDPPEPSLSLMEMSITRIFPFNTVTHPFFFFFFLSHILSPGFNTVTHPVPGKIKKSRLFLCFEPVLWNKFKIGQKQLVQFFRIGCWLDLLLEKLSHINIREYQKLFFTSFHFTKSCL